MGLDEKSKGARVYWPKRRNITVERNVYFDNSGPVERLEGENYELVEAPTVPTLTTDIATPEIVSEPLEAPTTRPTISDAPCERWI